MKRATLKKQPEDTPYSLSLRYLEAYMNQDYTLLGELLDEKAMYDMPVMEALTCQPEIQLPILGREKILLELQSLWQGISPQKFQIVHSHVSDERVYFHVVFYFTRKGKDLAGAESEWADHDFEFVMPANLLLQLANNKIVHHFDYPDWAVIYPQIRQQMTGAQAA